MVSSSRDDILINIENRIFYLSGDISNETVGKIGFNILYLNREDDKKETSEVGFTRQPIHLYIHSFGGEAYDMWALIDIILNSKTPVYTYCTGYAMSAGFKIFLAGHKRFATQHSTFMCHQMNCYRHGKYQDLVEDRVEMDYLQSANEKFIVERTKITQAQLDENKTKKQDWYMHFDEALALGVVTDILN